MPAPSTTAPITVIPKCLCATALALLALACSRAEGAGDPTGPGALPVQALTLQQEPVRESAYYLAQLVSRHQVALYPQVVGNVRTIFVKPGDKVKTGAPLLQIDPQRESANLSNEVAARAQKRASLDLATKTESRSALLLKEGLVSKQQFDQDRSQREVAEEELHAQDARIASQQAQLGYYRILAPFDATVGDIPVKVGDFVAAQTKLTSLDDNSNLEAYVNIPAESLKLLGPTSTIEVLDADRQALAEAPVSFIADEANPQTQSILIKAVFPNDKALRAAQVVNARVVFSSHAGLRVPTSAVIRQSGQFFVWRAEPGPQGGEVARQTPVTLGEIDDSRYTVERGLKPGDRVITSQIQKLRDGAPVQPEASPDAGLPKP
jgi:RND family efflux transporter MFP subunit